MSVSTFFSKEEQTAIIDTIKETEKKTSIEIRIHIESSCKENIFDHAAYVFKKLKMHKTKQRTGILLYLALQDKKYAILGDIGVNQYVNNTFWEILCNDLKKDFENENFSEGIIKSIIRCGKELELHLPVGKDDIDELPNTVNIG